MYKVMIIHTHSLRYPWGIELMLGGAHIDTKIHQCLVPWPQSSI